MYFATVGIVGFFRRDIGLLTRVVLTVAGAAAILPDLHIGLAGPGLISGLGVLVGGAVLTYEYLNHRRAIPAGDAAK